MTHPTTLPHRWWPTAALSTAAMLVGFLALGLLWTSSSPDRAQADDRGFKMTTKELKSEKRIALVIGNANYTVGRLANPVNDARAMATALSELGFEVTLHTNLKQNAMKRAIIDFGRKLRKARGGVGLFYYAGHGMQVRGRNYLIPLGATIEGESYVDVEAVDMGQVMAAMGEARNRLNIMVLDACRNNPFEQATRSMSRGLAFTSAPQGTLIAYATSPGRVAADGAGRNGTYTEALLKHMKTPGLPIEEMFKRVRSDVISVTDQQQTPWESSSLTGRFEFVVGDKPATATTSPTVVCPEGSKRVDGRCVADVVCPSGTTFVKGRGCVAGRPTPKGRSGRNALTPQQLVSLWSSACANGKSAFYKASYKPLTGDTILADGGMGLWTLGPPVPAILSAFMKTAQIDTSKLNNHNGHSIYSSLQMLGRISGIKPNLKAVTGEHGDFFHVNPALMPWVETLLPKANQTVCGGQTALELYNTSFKPAVRTYASALLYLHEKKVDSWFKGKQRTTYFEDAFSDKTRAGKTCIAYGQQLRQKPHHGVQVEWDDVAYQACHFWFRRTADGSRKAVAHLLGKVLNNYDKALYRRIGRRLR